MESKKVNLPEIDKIVKASLDAVHEHKILIKSMNEFANQFEQMVKSECPEFSEKSKIIAAFIRGAMDQETIIASAEERMAEDLNDLSARYEVLLRLGSEIQNKSVNKPNSESENQNSNEIKPKSKKLPKQSAPSKWINYLDQKRLQNFKVICTLIIVKRVSILNN